MLPLSVFQLFAVLLLEVVGIELAVLGSFFLLRQPCLDEFLSPIDFLVFLFVFLFLSLCSRNLVRLGLQLLLLNFKDALYSVMNWCPFSQTWNELFVFVAVQSRGPHH